MFKKNKIAKKWRYLIFLSVYTHFFSCESSITLTSRESSICSKDDCKKATDLKWLSNDEVTSLPTTITWNPPRKSDALSAQSIQFYSGESCNEKYSAAVTLNNLSSNQSEFSPSVNGVYSFKVTVIDQQGTEIDSLCSPSTTVNVASLDAKPEIANVSTTISSGYYRAGTTIPIEFEFDQVVYVTGIPKLTLETGAVDAEAIYVSGSGTKYLIFNYVVANSQSVSQLNWASNNPFVLDTATIKNEAAKDAILDLSGKPALSAEKTITIDTTTPSISAISSQSAARNGSSSSIAFTIDDSHSNLACTDNYLSIQSSDNSILQASGAVFGGTYPNCSVVLTPVTNAVGNTNVSIVVVDRAGNYASSTFSFGVVVDIALGQPSTTSNVNLEYGLNAPKGAIIVGAKLIAADYSNNRVLIWNTIPTTSNTLPNVVLGQENLWSVGQNRALSNPTASTLSGPIGLASDGTKLAVADFSNNRILIWNAIPTTNGAAADVVVGEPDFATSLGNNGSVTASKLQGPEGVAFIGSKLYVADTTNNRVLIWNSVPTTNSVAADIVLGQANFASNSANSGGVSATTLAAPTSIASDGAKLFVSDKGNSRVLGWNSIPTSNATAANFALGQVGLTSATVNHGTGISTAASMFCPWQVIVSGSKLYVVDNYNHRVLLWSSIPATNGALANFVIGQPDFSGKTANNGGISGATLNSPKCLASNGTVLFICDQDNNRILGFNSIPSSNAVSADLVIGQASFTRSRANPGTETASGLKGTVGIAVAGSKLIVADTNNNRVLIWNSEPTTSGQPADVVLGQPNFTTMTANTGGRSGSTMYGPASVYSDGTKLYVADINNSRVLIWNTIPTVSGASADLVIGQPTLTSSAGIGANLSLNAPYGMTVCGNKFYVADYGNMRVLGWNSVPTINGQAPDFVLGQVNMSTYAFVSPPSASTLLFPFSVNCVGNKLLVGDTWANRILIWNSAPTINAQPADIVLGQGNMTSSTGNNGGVTASSLYGAMSASSNGSKLYVADTYNHRVLVWNSFPITNGQPADAVIGQPDFVSNTPNSPTLNASSLSMPTYAVASGSIVYISDNGNNRVLVKSYP
jgi:hypothetical protein